jgi:hypothetical protein
MFHFVNCGSYFFDYATVDRISSLLLLHGKKRLDLFYEPAESIAGREQWLRLWQHTTKDELYTREC